MNPNASNHAAIWLFLRLGLEREHSIAISDGFDQIFNRASGAGKKAKVTKLLPAFSPNPNRCFWQCDR